MRRYRYYTNRSGRRTRNRRGHVGGGSAAYGAGYERTFGKKGRAARPRSRVAARAAAPAAARAPSRKYPKGQSPAQKRARRRYAAARKYMAKGAGKKAAARRAMRDVPYLSSERGRSFMGVGAIVRHRTSVPRQYSTRTTTAMRKRRVKTRVRRKVRVAYGRYKRVSLTDPRTGKRKLSYMYRDRRGRLRKIPLRSIVREAKGAHGLGGVAQAARVSTRLTRARSRRSSAARRLEQSGGPFIANRSKRMKRRKNKSRKRSLAAKRAWRKRKSRRGKRSHYARRAWRKRVVKRGRGYRGVKLARGKVYYRGRRPKGIRRGKARKLPRARLYLTNRKKRRKSRRRRSNPSTAMMLMNRRPRRRRGAKRRRRNRAVTSAYTPNRRKRRMSRRTARARGRRRNGNGYRRNLFGGNLMDLVKKGVVVFLAFVATKAITMALTVRVLIPYVLLDDKTTVTRAQWLAGLKKPSTDAGATAGLGAADGGISSKEKMVEYAPILMGIPVTLGLLWANGRFGPAKFRTEVAGGIVASFLHTAIVTIVYAQAYKAKDVGGAWTWNMLNAHIGGQMAGLGRVGGLGRRGVRGLGGRASVLPQYVPLGPPGGLQQPVAGGRMGEYFSSNGATSGIGASKLGEYFVQNAEAVGNYEQAGPLVTNAAAGLGQVIDDGIRPDSNLDEWLNLAEAQAGLGGRGRPMPKQLPAARRGGFMQASANGMGGGRAMGEYFAARRDNGGFQEYSVPQQNQWIPNGPVWAGTMPAGDAAGASEIPAGILETPGGNGIFG